MTIEQKELDQYEQLIQGLIDSDYGCIDDFINIDQVKGLRDNIKLLTTNGQMHAAGLGKNDNFQKDKRFRGDRIKWLHQPDKDIHEHIFHNKINGFISHLNKTCYTSITNFESHYASYEKNSFYKRHLDQFKNDTSRKFSVILYLNEDWQAEDGGLLSLYPEGKAQLNIAPIGGRLVFFRSNEMEHEVHPSTTRERISIAGWMKT